LLIFRRADQVPGGEACPAVYVQTVGPQPGLVTLLRAEIERLKQEVEARLRAL